MAKLDPVPWNIYVRAANDLDVGRLIDATKQQLSAVLPGVVEQLQNTLTQLGQRARGEPSQLSQLSQNGVMVFILMARLELLETLKDHMTPAPRVAISEAEAIRIADARWKEWDRTYDEWDYWRAITKLREDGLIRLHPRRKTEGCRFTFLKSPTDYPYAYRAFGKVAEYYRVDLGYNQTTFVGQWADARGTPGRVVVTAAVAKAGRRPKRQPEPPLDAS